MQFYLTGFHLLLSTQLTANLTLEWSGGSIFHPLSHFCKNSLLLHWISCKQSPESSMRSCFLSTVSKRGTHFENSFLIDKCLCKIVNIQLSDIYNSSAPSRNFNLRLAKTILWSFLVFSETTAECWQLECSASFLSVRPRFKSVYPRLNCCFRQNRVPIPLIKLLLCLNSIFPC